MNPRDLLWTILLLKGVTSTVSTEHICRAHLFNCGNGKCVGTSFLCDGDDDCLNMADEVNCPENPNPGCERSKVPCLTGNECIHPEWKCDGEADCEDASDEADCSGKNKSCDGFTCKNGHCLSIESRCEKNLDCSNGEDELNCNALPTQPSIPAVSMSQPALPTSSQPSATLGTTSEPPKPLITTSQPYMAPVTTSELYLPTDASSGLSMSTVPTVFLIFFNSFCVRLVVNKFHW